ncbi:MAG: T9SS type A sorting domain-containing protein [Ferruginibacter sp.]
MFITCESPVKKQILERKVFNPTQKDKKKTVEERAAFEEARWWYDFYLQANPLTGTIPEAEKELELIQSKQAMNDWVQNGSNSISETYISRGPTNFGGRTRAIAYDITDGTGNTLLAGGISGGIYRTTNGGASWASLNSANREHNVTAIVQDPRVGFRNIWYYSTGESLGNSASLSGAFYLGFGVWQSIDNGLTWTKMSLPAGVNLEFTFDHRFDLISRLAVHPTTGDLFVAALGCIFRYDISASAWLTELTVAGGFSSNHMTDVVIATTGRVYVAFAGVTPAAQRGIWTSINATGAGAGTWTNIATNAAPVGWAQGAGTGRAVMALAPSNQNLLYVLYEDGTSSNCAGVPAPEADLWRWDQAATTWTNYSATLPDEAGCLNGNDPFAVQGGYDLAVNVKPDNANFVVIGGTNAYKKTDITAGGTFSRIGGYVSSVSYGLYANHHPDIHALVFSPFNPLVLVSGDDGGIQRTNDITAATTVWASLNNSYQTYQYYYVNIDPLFGSDAIIGGAQDNGTTAGGTTLGNPDLTTMFASFSGDGCAAAISRQDPCLPFFESSQGGNLFRDCPVGTTITPTGSVSDFVTYFHLDPANQANLYYAGQGRLWKTNNSQTVTAGTWTNMGLLSTIPPGGFTDFIRSFATTWQTYNAATSYVLIGTDEGKIFRLTDPRSKANLLTATNITPAGATLGFPSIVNQIAIHPTNPDIVMAVYSNYGIPSIFLTTNATAPTPTWTLVERNISALSARSVAITFRAGQTKYFVGTSRGLYSTLNPLTTDWVIEGPAVLNFSVISNLAYRPADFVLLVGTHGNGMYQTTLTVVPVVMGELVGKQVNNTGVLTWKTFTESNNRGFNVQRSFDGVNFSTIGFVPARSMNTNTGHNYEFTDPNLSALQYYRLQQQDIDNRTKLSNVVVLKKRAANEIFVYPNPVTDNFTVKLGQPSKNRTELKLTDLNGRGVKNWLFLNTNALLVVNLKNSELASGNYMLSVYQDNVLVSTMAIRKR